MVLTVNILFLTLFSFESIKERTLYTDLLREFVNRGHHIYAISPVEKKYNIETHMVLEERAQILRLRIGNTQKTNIIEKGISTIMIEPLFKNALTKYFKEVKFDLILYSTPPITLVSAINYAKKRDNAKTYLLLKDIFPQNALDIGLMTTKGIKGLIYKHFRKQEKRLYQISDRIGCMSEANVEYVLKHNPELTEAKVEVCPNSFEVIDKSVDLETRNQIRAKYGIPVDKKIIIYGGNLGKPQGILYLIECIKKCKDIDDIYFLIVGDGTEFGVIKKFVETSEQSNVNLMKRLPKDDYDTMVGACDVGLIFLDPHFTIPNFPSRLLAYMQAKIPVLACTDNNSDIGKVITDGGFGWWCNSGDPDAFLQVVQEICTTYTDSKDREFNYLRDHFSVKNSVDIILKEL